MNKWHIPCLKGKCYEKPSWGDPHTTFPPTFCGYNWVNLGVSLFVYIRWRRKGKDACYRSLPAVQFDVRWSRHTKGRGAVVDTFQRRQFCVRGIKASPSLFICPHHLVGERGSVRRASSCSFWNILRGGILAYQSHLTVRLIGRASLRWKWWQMGS